MAIVDYIVADIITAYHILKAYSSNRRIAKEIPEALIQEARDFLPRGHRNKIQVYVHGVVDHLRQTILEGGRYRL